MRLLNLVLLSSSILAGNRKSKSDDTVQKKENNDSVEEQQRWEEEQKLQQEHEQELAEEAAAAAASNPVINPFNSTLTGDEITKLFTVFELCFGSLETQKAELGGTTDTRMVFLGMAKALGRLDLGRNETLQRCVGRNAYMHRATDLNLLTQYPQEENDNGTLTVHDAIREANDNGRELVEVKAGGIYRGPRNFQVTSEQVLAAVRKPDGVTYEADLGYDLKNWKPFGNKYLKGGKIFSTDAQLYETRVGEAGTNTRGVMRVICSLKNGRSVFRGVLEHTEGLGNDFAKAGFQLLQVAEEEAVAEAAEAAGEETVAVSAEGATAAADAGVAAAEGAEGVGVVEVIEFVAAIIFAP